MKHELGFSLLETIVAIAILTLAILGPLALASFTLQSASLSENEIVAYNLAEEALEYVINKRDSNAFSGNSNWISGLTTCQSANGCFIDAPNNSVSACSANCPLIRRDNNTGLYNYLSGTNTIFTRRVFLKNVPGNNDEQRVEVLISWQERLASHSFVIVHHIFKKR